ncbi:unnamed protein product [Brassica oleracea]
MPARLSVCRSCYSRYAYAKRCICQFHGQVHKPLLRRRDMKQKNVDAVKVSFFLWKSLFIIKAVVLCLKLLTSCFQRRHTKIKRISTAYPKIKLKEKNNNMRAEVELVTKSLVVIEAKPLS